MVITQKHLEVGALVPFDLAPGELVRVQQVRVELYVLVGPLRIPLKEVELLLEIGEIAKVEPLLGCGRDAGLILLLKGQCT
jgi:hypothetical protein